MPCSLFAFLIWVAYATTATWSSTLEATVSETGDATTELNTHEEPTETLSSWKEALPTGIVEKDKEEEDVEEEEDDPLPIFPLLFTATITIESHLIPIDSEYPPRFRRMSVYYDYPNKRARIDIEAGYEAAKVFYRRYDKKNEYMVRLPPINDCKRAYLGDIMPYPDLCPVGPTSNIKYSDFGNPDQSFRTKSPTDSSKSTKKSSSSSCLFVREESISGILCNYFLFEEFNGKIHIYLSVADNAPVKLIQETRSAENGSFQPVLTYDYSDVVVGEEISAGWFDLPLEYTHKDCVRHVGGWPYIHLFHHFVRV